MVYLRGHHLICLRFFQGQGYDAAFLAGVEEVRQRLAAGEQIVVMAGPDAVCRVCPWLQGDECTHPETTDAGIRKMDQAALEILHLTPDSRWYWPQFTPRELESGFAEWFRGFCRECSWRPACQAHPDFQALLKKIGEEALKS
ncbi:MAG: DUF1284 domain-containing protein [Deltaproteobacteria bacterium]|nr:DUF1284 domain-containing protein [Deltaproteobacteria bacterium]